MFSALRNIFNRKVSSVVGSDDEEEELMQALRFQSRDIEVLMAAIHGTTPIYDTVELSGHCNQQVGLSEDDSCMYGVCHCSAVDKPFLFLAFDEEWVLATPEFLGEEKDVEFIGQWVTDPVKLLWPEHEKGLFKWLDVSLTENDSVHFYRGMPGPIVVGYTSITDSLPLPVGYYKLTAITIKDPRV